MGKSDAFLKKLGLDLSHIHGVIAESHWMRVEAKLVLLLVDGDKLVLHHTHSQQRTINLLIIGLDELDCLTCPILAFSHRYVQTVQLHVLQSQRLGQFLLGDAVAHLTGHKIINFFKYVPDGTELK